MRRLLGLALVLAACAGAPAVAPSQPTPQIIYVTPSLTPTAAPPTAALTATPMPAPTQSFQAAICAVDEAWVELSGDAINMMDPDSIGGREARAARITAETRLGRIRSSLDAIDAPEGGGQTVVNHLYSVVGLTQQFLDKMETVQDAPSVDGIREVSALFGVAIDELKATRVEASAIGLDCPHWP